MTHFLTNSIRRVVAKSPYFRGPSKLSAEIKGVMCTIKEGLLTEIRDEQE